MAQNSAAAENSKTITKKRKSTPDVLSGNPKRLNFDVTSPELLVPSRQPGPSVTPTTVVRPKTLQPPTHSLSLSNQNVPSTSRRTTTRREICRIPPPIGWNAPSIGQPSSKISDQDEPPDEEGEEYERLEVIYYEQVRSHLGLEDNRDMGSGTQDRNRTKMLSQIRWLRGTWNLYNVAPLYRFIYADEQYGADGREHDVEWCLRRQISALVQTLKNKKAKIFKDFSRTKVLLEPFRGFDAFTTYSDEPAYFFKIFGKKNEIDAKWMDLCTIILGSIGTHEEESLYRIKGDQFAFYPFVLARGDHEVLTAVFHHLSERHGYQIGNQHGFRRPQFSSADMWRILTCCVFFIQRIQKTHVLKLTLKQKKISEDLEWDFDFVDIYKEIWKRRRQLDDDYNKKHYMTTRQITLVKNAVKKAYKERFEKDWNRKTTFLKKIQLHCLSVTSDGCLRSEGHKEAIAFLYYISRFRTRTYVHPIHGITFEAVNPLLGDYTEDEEVSVKDSRRSTSVANSLFQHETTYVR